MSFKDSKAGIFLNESLFLIFSFSKRFLFELITVTLGIFIALYVNNWNETQKKQETMQQVLKLMRMEAEGNIKEIDKSFNKTIEVVKTVFTYKDNSTQTIQEVLQINKGLSFPSVKNFSYRVLPNTDIKFVANYWKCFSMLAEIEEMTAFLQNYTDKLTSFFSENSNNKTPEAKYKLLIILNEICSFEDQTRTVLKKLVVELKKIEQG